MHALSSLNEAALLVDAHKIVYETNVHSASSTLAPRYKSILRWREMLSNEPSDRIIQSPGRTLVKIGRGHVAIPAFNLHVSTLWNMAGCPNRRAHGIIEV